MNKLIVMKIVGIVAAIVVVVIAGVTVVVNMNRHSNSVVVKVAQQIKPVRVNPLIAESDKVYNFIFNDYLFSHLDSRGNFDYADCYYKGGYVPNGNMMKRLKSDCRNEAKRFFAYAKQKNKFQNATLNDWLDQNFIKKIYEQNQKDAKKMDL